MNDQLNTFSEQLWRDRKGYLFPWTVGEYVDSSDRLFSLATIAGQWDFFYTKKELESLSEYHLRLARKEHGVLIGQTKFGTLNLSYVDKVYSLVKCGFEPETIASGAKKAVKEALISAYQIV